MHPPTQFRFEGFQLASHPISARLALQQEAPRPRPAADVREAQKGERRRLAQATILPVFRRMAAKLDESRLVRVQR
jgi:hypothetical protein